MKAMEQERTMKENDTFWKFPGGMLGQSRVELAFQGRQNGLL